MPAGAAIFFIKIECLEIIPSLAKRGGGDLAEVKTESIRKINIVIKSPLAPLF
jgi:hypothetical protein